MKLIGHLAGLAALKETPEEYAPVRGATRQEITDLVRSTYSFSVFPNADSTQFTALPGAPSPLMFQQGKFNNGDESFAIALLSMESGGDILQATTTEQAELALLDLLSLLDNELGFRFNNTAKNIQYISTVVVEFENAIENEINKVKLMAEAISASIPHRPYFGLKRLAFGAPVMRAPQNQIENVEASDFLIERRAEATVEQNRYFCSAPMRTQDHLRLLTELETIALG